MDGPTSVRGDNVPRSISIDTRLVGAAIYFGLLGSFRAGSVSDGYLIRRLRFRLGKTGRVVVTTLILPYQAPCAAFSSPSPARRSRGAGPPCRGPTATP